VRERDAIRADNSIGEAVAPVKAQRPSGNGVGRCCSASGNVAKHYEEEIEQTGSNAKAYVTASFSVAGMRCPSCARRVETALSKCPGVIQALVDVAGGTAWVRYRPGEVNMEELQAAVEASGYLALVAGASSQEKNKKESRQLSGLGPYLIPGLRII